MVISLFYTAGFLDNTNTKIHMMFTGRMNRILEINNADMYAVVEQAFEEIFDKALAMGGTLSGEHGTGIAKAPFLEKEAGYSSILFPRQLRAALDPRNILNPGKITGV